MLKQRINIFASIAPLLISSQLLLAQLTINTSLTPQQLVQNVLLGSGVTASNITYTGSINAIAQFGGSTNLGISSGVIMTTGVTTGANGPQGPNNSTSSGTDNNASGDSLLSSINSDSTHNAAILEFDFVPTGDSIKFRYVFGSEEYPEYACGAYNDIFGFFISGPNPGGGNYVKQNVAIIPGSSLPVSIKNINNSGCSSYPQYYVDNINGTSIQYDGFTTSLTALAAVKCGSTYHIKLAIADVSDANFDSGVFLEGGSFSSKSISIKAKVAFGSNDTTIYEGCGQSSLTLKRSINTIVKADSIDYTLTGTAINGSDYTLTSSNISGNKVIFPAGVDSIQLSLNALQDLIGDGGEYFTLTLNIIQCNMPTKTSVTIYIKDVPPLKVSASNDTTLNCPNKTITLNALASGGIGIGNYNYIWSHGAVGSSISVSPISTTTYVVNVKDTCGLDKAIDSVTVIVNYVPLTLNVSGNIEICPGTSTTLVATPKFGLAAYRLNWQPGNDTVNSIVVTPGATTTYTVTVIDNCGMQLTKTTAVIISPIQAGFDFTSQPNQEVAFWNTSVDALNSYWFFGDTAYSTVPNPTHTYGDTGTYTVTLIVTNAIGCKDTVAHTFIVYPDLHFYFPNSFTPNNNGLNEVFTAKGYGIANYKMTIYDRWGSLIFTSDDINVGWDGKTNHAKAQIESYVCVFDVADHHGNNVRKIGHVLLIR